MRLAGSTVYLCGAVENTSDSHNWRNDLSRQLLELDMVPLDPLVKPSWFSDVTVDEQRSWKRVIRDQYDSSLSSLGVNKIWGRNAMLREFCLHLVASANVVVFKFDCALTVGSFFELSLCRYKPVFVLAEDPALSTWLIAELGIVPHELKEYFHKDVSSLMSFWREIDCGRFTPSDMLKWMYLTYRIDK